ncbi:MAG: hypothetical protein INQ03_07955 [Candidatus Heimdallarchaeota archaeon]|nr:hypothetical protein [Candidatus Heimdallarchaeota archaeon]
MHSREDKTALYEIFNHHPELQNWSSSSWWFFLLLPKQERGYGPKQMMFTFASRMGEEVGVGDSWQVGMQADRPLYPIDRFATTVAGWINDGDQIHKNIVFTPANAELDYKQRVLSAWNGNHGGKIELSDEHQQGLKAEFKGERGSATFSIWADDDNELEIPQIVKAMGPVGGKLGNIHAIAWRKFRFEGKFVSPSGAENLEGYGYFQRILMNIPLQSWMWSYIIFEDGSVFSSFMMYIGPNSVKREFVYSRQWLERLRYNIKPSAYFFDNKTKEMTYFDTAKIIPQLGENIRFFVEATTEAGDCIRLKLISRNKTGFSLNRRIFKRMWMTKYLWREHMTEVEACTGKIKGDKIRDLGYGYGNMEYSRGMSL